MTNLKIKNMVCARCIMAVTQTLVKLAIEPQSVSLGSVVIAEELSTQQMQHLRAELHNIGFEVIDDPTEKLVMEIKQTIIAYVRADKPAALSITQLLAEQFRTDYATLSRTFASAEGRSIEKFYLQQRIEYVKELIQYGELNIKEIAWRTNFSSVAHLSRQFKQYTGLTPTAFKNCKVPNRTALDKV